MILLHYAGGTFELNAEQRDKLLGDLKRLYESQQTGLFAVRREGRGDLVLVIGPGIPLAITTGPDRPEKSTGPNIW